MAYAERQLDLTFMGLPAYNVSVHIPRGDVDRIYIWVVSHYFPLGVNLSLRQ